RAAGEDGVDLRLVDAGVAQRVPRGLRVHHDRRLVRHDADLVRLVGADDGDAVLQAHAAPPAGLKSGSVISSLASSHVTSTGMSHRTVSGEGSMPTRFVISRGPSSSSTIAVT